jgi:hypothetical protein
MSPSSVLFLAVVGMNLVILGVCIWLLVKLLWAKRIVGLQADTAEELNRENARLLRELAERG